MRKLMWFDDGDIIFSNKLSSMSEEEKEEVTENLLTYLYGYIPQYNISTKRARQIIIKLDRYNVNNICKGNIINQNQLGISLVGSFHPHMFSIKCRNFMTAVELYNDKDHLHKCIKKYIDTSNSKRFSDSSKISVARTASRVQVVSNFRPTVAKLMYDKYANDGVVLDPCTGFGGRLLGSWCSSNVKKYVGIDPSTKTYEGNLKLYDFLKCNDYFSFNKTRPEVELHCIPFEEFETDTKFDFIFTSPPYFNTEKYSDEDTQSWKRYDTYGTWLEQFLKVLIEKSYNFLKDDKYFCINVSPKMKEDCINIASQYFGNPVKIYGLKLSTLPLLKNIKTTRNLKLSDNNINTEPMIIFKKGEKYT